MTGSLRRLAAVACLAVLLAAAFLPGGGPPLPAVLPAGPALAGPAASRARVEAARPALRVGTVIVRSGRAPPTSA